MPEVRTRNPYTAVISLVVLVAIGLGMWWLIQYAQRQSAPRPDDLVDGQVITVVGTSSCMERVPEYPGGAVLQDCQIGIRDDQGQMFAYKSAQQGMEHAHEGRIAITGIFDPAPYQNFNIVGTLRDARVEFLGANASAAGNR